MLLRYDSMLSFRLWSKVNAIVLLRQWPDHSSSDALATFCSFMRVVTDGVSKSHDQWRGTGTEVAVWFDYSGSESKS